MSSRSRNFVPGVHPCLVHSQKLSESTLRFGIGAQTLWTAVHWGHNKQFVQDSFPSNLIRLNPDRLTRMDTTG